MKKTLLSAFGLVSALQLGLVSTTHAAALPQAPELTAQTLTGRSIDLSQFRGEKPVYLKFWATWCNYCKAEMPHLQSIKDNYGDEVEVISVNVGFNQTPAGAQAYMQRNGYDLPVVFDADGAITRSFNVVGTPQHILIDRDGHIAYRTFLATDQLDQMIEHWSEDKPQGEQQ